MITKMQQYLNSTRCRRQMLLSHFEGHEVTHVGGTDICCDNCRKRLKRAKNVLKAGSSQNSLDDKKDFTEEAKLLFAVIEYTNGSFGLSVPILILRGSSSQRMSERMKNCPQYGMGKHKSDNWWKAFGRLLMCEKYLVEKKTGSGNFFSVVDMSDKSKRWFAETKQIPNKAEPFILEMNAELLALEETKAPAILKQSTSPPVRKVLSAAFKDARGELSEGSVEKLDEETSSLDDKAADPQEEILKGELYKKLMALRNKMADQDGLAPYMVFSNKNLLDMVVYRPSSLKSLSQIEGITAARISKFGQAMIDVITSFCKENALKEDVFPPKEGTRKLSPTTEAGLRALTPTVQETYRLYAIEKRSLPAAAKIRGMTEETLITHLAQAIKVGLPVDLDGLSVTQDIIDVITKVILSPPINSDVSRLSPIKQLCPPYIEFKHIKIVIALLQSKFGVDEIPVPSKESSVNEKSPSEAKQGVNNSPEDKEKVPFPKRKDSASIPNGFESSNVKRMKT
ncbi:Werner syndrome ATP-dependent helicase, partial [Stegodyphus mimosarum]